MKQAKIVRQGVHERQCEEMENIEESRNMFFFFFSSLFIDFLKVGFLITTIKAEAGHVKDVHLAHVYKIEK